MLATRPLLLYEFLLSKESDGFFFQCQASPRERPRSTPAAMLEIVSMYRTSHTTFRSPLEQKSQLYCVKATHMTSNHVQVFLRQSSPNFHTLLLRVWYLYQLRI